MRKFIYIFLFLIIAGGVVWYFIPREGKKSVNYKDNSAFKAVPIHSPFVIEIADMERLFNLFTENNPIPLELKSAGLTGSVADDLNYLAEVMKANSEYAYLFNDHSLLISVNFEGRNETDYIFLSSMNGKTDQQAVLGLIKQCSKEGGLSKRNYDNAEIYRVIVNGHDFSFAFTNGIFVASRKAILVEEAIRQSNTESLPDQPDFQKLHKTANADALANLYINHRTFAQLLPKILQPDLAKKIRFLARYAERTELDLSVKQDALYLSGFTFSNDSSGNYINTFGNQEPGKSNIEAVLPANTSMFISLPLENPALFLDDYQAYSRLSGSFYEREARLMEINKDTKSDFLKIFKEMCEGELGIAFTNIAKNAPTDNRFFIVKVKSQSVAREQLDFLVNKYIQNKKPEEKDWHSEYRLDAKRSYPIMRFPYPDLSELLFGKLFSGVACNYFSLIDNTLVFADSQAALKEYLYALVLGGTLEKDTYYQAFKTNAASRSNLNMYLNFPRAINLQSQYFNSGLAAIFSEQEETIRKFYAMNWQLSRSSDLFLNTICIKYDPTVKEEPQTIWQSKLDGNLQIRPQFVMNHNDPNNRELVLQDRANQLCLINKEGVSLWKVKVSGPILSEIHQIDIYKNDKYQYLFNTADFIYLIDRNGEAVKGYPISLRSPATNGLAVFDYDNKKDYRFMVACSDKKIYAFTKEGKFLKGWNQFESDNEVRQPIQFIRVQNKDYLVFSDRYKTYYLNRQGVERMTTQASFEQSGNPLIFEGGSKPALLCTDKQGALYRLFFDGSFSKQEMGNFGESHYFTSADLDKNGKYDFIYAEGLQLTVISDAGKKLIDKKMKAPITERPDIFILGKTKKIGLVCGNENRVYLINADGSVYPGFPLQGSTVFGLGSFSNASTFSNLLVGNNEQSLYNYMVE